MVKKLLLFLLGALIVGLLVYLIESCMGPSLRVGPFTPNPGPAVPWYPFDEYPLTEEDKENGLTTSPFADRRLSTADHFSKWFDSSLDASTVTCSSKVISLNVNLTGNISGNLSFNLNKRRGGTFPNGMNNGNTQLGGVEDNGILLRSQHYKFEVVVEFDNLEEGFYGQMISDHYGWTWGGPNVEFHDDHPANDHAELNLANLGPDEKIEDFPVFEVQGNTIRWIDGPNYNGFSWVEQHQYVLVYAGSCGVVTHLEIIEITYPSSGIPSATILSKEDFEARVDEWRFIDNE